MIFNTIEVWPEDTVIPLPSGWTYLEEGMEPQMRKELFDETFYFYETELTEVFVREGLLLW